MYTFCHTPLFEIKQGYVFLIDQLKLKIFFQILENFKYFKKTNSNVRMKKNQMFDSSLINIYIFIIC